MFSKRLFVLGLIVALLLTLAPLAAAQSTGDKKEVVVWMWTAHVTDLYKSWYKKITERFEKENPGATLRFEFVKWGPDKLMAAAAGGVGPDVSLASIAYARDLYEAGILNELNRFMADTPHMHADQFVPTSMIFPQKDGKFFGIPWSMEVNAILYNQEHLQEAGLDANPEAIGTWDDLVEYAKSLTRANSDGVITRSGYAAPFSYSRWVSYLYSNGGDFYNEGGGSVAFNSTEGVEALQFMRDTVSQYDIMAPKASSHDIANQTASMVMWDSSAVNWGIRPSAPDFARWLRMAPVPQGPHGSQPGAQGWSNMFVIPKTADDPQLSWAFIKLWLDPEVQMDFFKHFGGTDIRSPRRDFFESEGLADALKRLPYLQEFPRIFATAKPYPYIRYSEIGKELGRLFNQVRDGELDPSGALSEAERLSDSILKK